MLHEDSEYQVFSQFSSKKFHGSINSVDCDTVEKRFALCVTENGYYFIYDTFRGLCKILHHTKKESILTDGRWRKNDKQFFCCTSLDQKLRYFDIVDAKKPLHEYELFSRSHGCSFNYKAPIIAAALNNNSVRLIDTRQSINLHALSNKYESGVRAVEWSPSSEYNLAFGDNDGHLIYYDTRQPKEPYEFGWWKTYIDEDNDSAAHDSPVLGLAFAKNGRTFYSFDNEGFVKQWDTDTGLTTMTQFRLDKEPLRKRRYGICVIGNDILVPERNAIVNFHKRQKMSGHMKDVTALVENYDGFVSVSQDMYLCVWKHRNYILINDDVSDWSD